MVPSGSYKPGRRMTRNRVQLLVCCRPGTKENFCICQSMVINPSDGQPGWRVSSNARQAQRVGRTAVDRLRFLHVRQPPQTHRCHEAKRAERVRPHSRVSLQCLPVRPQLVPEHRAHAKSLPEPHGAWKPRAHLLCAARSNNLETQLKA